MEIPIKDYEKYLERARIEETEERIIIEPSWSYLYKNQKHIDTTSLPIEEQTIILMGLMKDKNILNRKDGFYTSHPDGFFRGDLEVVFYQIDHSNFRCNNFSKKEVRCKINRKTWNNYLIQTIKTTLKHLVN